MPNHTAHTAHISPHLTDLPRANFHFLNFFVILHLMTWIFLFFSFYLAHAMERQIGLKIKIDGMYLCWISLNGNDLWSIHGRNYIYNAASHANIGKKFWANNINNKSNFTTSKNAFGKKPKKNTKSQCLHIILLENSVVNRPLEIIIVVFFLCKCIVHLAMNGRIKENF